MSKAPWFPFYTGDFLASPDVQDMEAHEVGAYVLLLARSWQSDMPGYLEDDDYALRRAARLSAELWAQCKKALLKKWPLAENMPGFRCNPRLKKEADKQVELREKKSEAGLRSAAKREAARLEAERKATEGQQAANTISTPVEKSATGDAQNGNYSQPQPQPQSTNVDRQAASEPARLTSQQGGQRLRTHDDAPLFDPAKWPGLADPAKFAAICQQLDFPQVDFERYRKQILVSLEGKALPATSLRNWIKTYLNNDKDEGSLLLPVAQAPNERPSNYHGTEPYKALPGSRIPDMSSILNPNWKPPQA